MSNYWLHCNFITIDGEKVSKSLGNTYTLEQLEEQSYKPLDFKMWVLQGHFQGTRNFSFADLSAAKSRRLNWRNKAASAYQLGLIKKTSVSEKILAALNENLNSPEAFSAIDTNELNYEDWKFVDELFGLNIAEGIEETPDFVKRLMAEREDARKNKSFEVADQIREQLADNNYTVKDTPDGPIWQYMV
jgi:cysteinyl-tRNA synthetase